MRLKNFYDKAHASDSSWHLTFVSCMFSRNDCCFICLELDCIVVVWHLCVHDYSLFSTDDLL